MYTAAFWKDVFERVVATFAQTFLALVGVDVTGWLSLDWATIAITSLIAAGLSVLKSLASGLVGTPVPSVVNYEYVPPTVPAVDNR
jgi:hypothetical protein